MNKSLKSRFSAFFILLGIGALIIFIAYFLKKEVALDILTLGIVLILIGVTMREKREPTESARFASLRKIRQQKAEKAQKK